MNSFLAYLGGKSKLAKTITDMMPEHKCYCEVFAGAAWVYFQKEPSRGEILNDINGELTNLYKIVKHHLPELARYFKTELISREEFNRLKAVEPKYLTDVQRAARYYYILRHSFGARIEHPSFSCSSYGAARMDLENISKVLEAAHNRLNRTIIENMDYSKIITRYDGPDTLFYLDPPYYGGENDYGKGLFERDDYQRIANILKQIKGKYILSINDKPEIRELFQNSNIREVTVGYSASVTSRIKASELLITNY